MNTFDDRKKGFETKYLRDQEAQFKIRAKQIKNSSFNNNNNQFIKKN